MRFPRKLKPKDTQLFWEKLKAQETMILPFLKGFIVLGNYDSCDNYELAKVKESTGKQPKGLGPGLSNYYYYYSKFVAECKTVT